MKPHIYIEDPHHKIEPVFLSHEIYIKAIEALVIVCSDTVIIDRKKRTFFLAKRTSKPSIGWWIIGGRMNAGEKEEHSAQRTFKRETSLDVPFDRFQFVCINRYFSKDRQQEPQNKGCDSLVYTFAIELTEVERQTANQSLDADEYSKIGLREFDRKNLVKEQVRPMLLDLYDQIFND